MDFCPRCHGGYILAPNCLMCGGSGLVAGRLMAPSTKVPSPFRNTAEMTRQEREKEKRRKVKVFAVKQTPGERRQAEQEAFAAKCEAMRQRRAAELNSQAEARRRAPLEIHRTPEGTVVKSSYRKNKTSHEAPPRQQKAPATQPPPRESREAQSANQVRNTSLADQLSLLKGQLVTRKPHTPSPPPASKNVTPSGPAEKVQVSSPEPMEERVDPPRGDVDEKAATLSRKQRKEKRLAAKDPTKNKTRSRPFIRVKDGKLDSESPAQLGSLSEPRIVTVQSARLGRCASAGNAHDGVDLIPLRDDPDEEAQGIAGVFAARQREEDGGRYMGHSFRDRDGSYGSLPLYDNLDEYDE